MRRLNKARLWLAGLFLGATPGLAFAAGAGTLGQVQSSLQGSILPWQHTMQTAATDLFYALAAVEFSVLFLNHVLQKRGHEDLFAGIIKKVVTLGFFLTLLDNSGTWIPDIINGLAGGAQSLGVTQVSPGAIATDALKVFMELVESPFRAASHAVGNNGGNVFSDIWNGNFSGAVQSAAKTVAAANPLKILIEELMMVIIGLLAGLGILVMALEFLMVQIESYLVIALGVIMLAGGGLRWTAKYVGSYFDYAINVGVRLFILTALAFLVTDSITPIMEKILQNITNPLQSGFEAIILGAIIALLPRKASSIASSLLSGNSSFSGGELAKEGGIIAGGTVAAGRASWPWALARPAVSPLVDSPQRRVLEAVQPEALAALQAAALPEPRVRERPARRLVWRPRKLGRCPQVVVRVPARARGTPSLPPALAVRLVVKRPRHPGLCRLQRPARNPLASRTHPRVSRHRSRKLERKRARISRTIRE
ncbi:MAG: P-type conjugative transfer protein TrbL [Acidithiobacillus sp.]